MILKTLFKSWFSVDDDNRVSIESKFPLISAKKHLPMIFIGPHVAKSWYSSGKSIANCCREIKNVDVDCTAQPRGLFAKTSNSPLPFPVNAAQIFVESPQTGKVAENIVDVLSNVREFVTETNTRVVIHGSYCSSPWNGKPFPTHIVKRGLSFAADAGCEGYVIHLTTAGPDTVIAKLPGLFDPTRRTSICPTTGRHPYLYLESEHCTPVKSMYSGGASLGDIWVKGLYAINDANVDATGGVNPAKQLGICADTAHIFSCGVDIRSAESARDWLMSFFSVTGADNGIVSRRGALLFHLNDSALEFGCGNDKHDEIGLGNIWPMPCGDGRKPLLDAMRMNGALPGVSEFLSFADKHNVAIILERNDKDRCDLARELRHLQNISPGLSWPSGCRGPGAVVAQGLSWPSY